VNRRDPNAFIAAEPRARAARRRCRFVGGLKKLQDCLGELNDIAVHEALTTDLIKPGGRTVRVQKAFTAGRLSGRKEARVTAVLKSAKKAYGVFSKAKPYWN
jgi:triphosphatase